MEIFWNGDIFDGNILKWRYFWRRYFDVEPGIRTPSSPSLNLTNRLTKHLLGFYKRLLATYDYCKVRNITIIVNVACTLYTSTGCIIVLLQVHWLQHGVGTNDRRNKWSLAHGSENTVSWRARFWFFIPVEVLKPV